MVSPGADALLRRPILGLTPFESPDSALCIALARAGALAVLDLGRDERAMWTALASVSTQVPGEFGVRIPSGLKIDSASLPESVGLLVLPSPDSLPLLRDFRPCLVQVTTLEEARAAERGGAVGLIAKGSESGGRVGEETAFVLLQRLLQANLALPIWVQGGIGLHTAAAVHAAGARGIVLEAQLALVRESAVSESVKAAMSAMDGSETVVIAGHRLYSRPDLPAATLGPDTQEIDLLPRFGAKDLHEQLLPMGQDGALASIIARRYRTAGGVVRGFNAAIRQHLQQAQDGAALASDSPWAKAHGVRYPIAQGPMTRVSDRASFAAAVAAGGGLPFLALSLLRGEEVRELLAETRSQLGERPFGVGILGFVPAELRAEQLAVIEQLRPQVALIAGGRPDQARSLEAKGIATYLHVPSPALLDLFLADGARRFVFEGRECGGHVGPRSSFVLWEQMIERLLNHPAPEELSVLFAGGIHDARSGAMVAALTATLAARGARIGVLMGTAYLFTEEAVSSGAITSAFQQAAVACERTVLLETAPGHSTRCVESEYVQVFRDRRLALEALGKGPTEIWAELEQLNLGRLRLAAKGLQRDGEKLISVEAEVQRREGMFMIGQIAAARSNLLSIEQLHREVSEGSRRRLQQLEVPLPLLRENRAIDVAIVGMSAIFPKATDVKTYWANILGAVDCIQEVPNSRWSPELYFDPDSNDGAKTPSKWGGFLPDVVFDPLSYGIPPRSLGAIDPVQLLSLEVARQALADAGYLERAFDRDRTSVIFGSESGTELSSAYGFRALYPQLLGPMPKPLDDHLPKLSEDSFAGILSNVISGRIANRLDLGGVNYTVDAACASSLAALDLAVKELSSGQSEMVLCGGADLHNGINDFLMFASVHALSKRGKCATFDAAADGIALGEGVACVVLKRLADAERDGDRIYAVLRGVGGSSDGRSLGLTAPRKEGQMRALERAYQHAGVSPAEVGLVEAHGTGTVVGDRTELLSLTEIFQRGKAPAGSVALGSVKSQIGHTKCTAGLAGLIKAALALYHRVLPPTLHVTAPNPAYDSKQSPFVFSSTPRPWLSPGAKAGRKAAVSAFGFGGTNFHAVLSEYVREEPPAAGGVHFPAELFLFRGRSPEEARGRSGELAARLARPLAGTFTDLAFTLAGEGNGSVQIAVVAKDLEDLRRKLARAEAGTAGDGVYVSPPAGAPRGSVAFLFPGQGSQRVGMLGELFVAFPALQRLLELGRPWADAILPPAAFSDAESAEQLARLTDTRVAQPSLGVVELAALELLSGVGVSPDLVGGHSYGELVALCAAGALRQRDLLPLSVGRAESILAAVGEEPGAMAAVVGPLDQIREVCQATGVVPANQNSPTQVVIAGPRAALSQAIEQLAARGLSAKRLQVACAFHSPLLAGADAAFAKRLDAVELSPPLLPVFSNLTAAPYPADVARTKELLAKQLVSPVLFTNQIEAMYQAGARVFIEVGPGQVLTRLVGRILGDRPHKALTLAKEGRSNLMQLLELLAELAVRGTEVQLAPIFSGRQARRLDLHAPVAPPSASRWWVNGHLAWPAVGASPAGALRPTPEPIAVAQSPTAAVSDREGAVLTYLESMQQLVEAQREVMLRYLGDAAPQKREERELRPRIAAVVNGHAHESSLTAEPALPRPPPDEENGSALDISQTLLGLVSERTGYPLEMLNLDADLEAELSIDSIKRIEILGVLTQRLGLAGRGNGAMGELPMEKLSSLKTLRGISDWIEQRVSEQAEKLSLPAPPSVPNGATVLPAALLPQAPNALEWSHRVWTEEAAPQKPLAARRYWIAPDPSALVGRVALFLEDLGAVAFVQQQCPSGKNAIDGYLDLSGMGPDRVGLWEVFERSRAAIAAGTKELLVASRSQARLDGDHRGAGLTGLAKSLAAEAGDVRVCGVELDPEDSTENLVAAVTAELGGQASVVDAMWQRGLRRVAEVQPVAPADRANLGVQLSSDSVVLLTGGARGITSALALAIARRFRCKLELVGQRELSIPEADEFNAASDLPSLRKALIGSGRYPRAADVEAAAQNLWAIREATNTLEAIRNAGGQATYHAVDLRVPENVEKLLADLHGRYGRIDAVFHGAGVTEDRRSAEKTREGFTRVVDSKLVAAEVFARSLRPDLSLLVFFGSVSGVFGNRGQADYAAANAVLDGLARAMQGRFAGPSLSLDFGPWSGGGMVSPELAREYERRGVALIGLEAGIDAVMSLLFDSPPNPSAGRRSFPPQLILTAGPAVNFSLLRKAVGSLNESSRAASPSKGQAKSAVNVSEA